MKFGCASFFLPDPAYKQKLERAYRLGYEGIEVRLEENTELDQQVAEIEEAFAGSPVRPCNVIVRSPAYRAPLDSREAMQAKLASAKTAILIAERLGTTTVVQPEYCPQIPMPAFDPAAQTLSARKELLYTFLCDVADLAEKNSTIVLHEPLNRYESHYSHRLEEGMALCDLVGSSRIKLCADFFHMNLEEENIAASLESAGKYVYYVQLGDSNRRLPGKGHIDFRAAFASLLRIGYDGFLALECMKPLECDRELGDCVHYLHLCLEDSRTLIE